MSLPWIALLSGLATAAAVAAAWLLARARVRYRELLEAVQLVQRQATELRTRLEESRERVERIEERLGRRVEPQLERLGRHLELEAAAAEVGRAEGAGRLAPEVARRLRDHLAALEAEIAAAGRPF